MNKTVDNFQKVSISHLKTVYYKNGYIQEFFFIGSTLLLAYLSHFDSNIKKKQTIHSSLLMTGKGKTAGGQATGNQPTIRPKHEHVIQNR